MLDYLEQNKDITNLSWFRTKAVSRYFFEIKTEDDINKLVDIYAFSRFNNLELYFIWQGTNILFTFEEFSWIIIKNSLAWYNLKNNILEVKSGELVSKLAKEMFEKEWNQFFYAWVWLPGTLGWAIIWNAWCFWLEMKDLLISTKILNLENWEILDYSNRQLDFSYRNSKLKEQTQYFIISAKINLDCDLIVDTNFINEIRQKQPKWLSCGSFYKNPQGNSAGKLIDEAWLKGLKIGWAFISSDHANFLMSDTTATCVDILELNNIIKQTIFGKFAIELKEEVTIIQPNITK